MSKLSSVINQVSSSDLTKVYTAYSYGGLPHAGAAVATSFTDKMLSSAYKTEKNYATLTTFWGYLAYKAVSDLTNNNKIPDAYKIPVYTLAALTVAGITKFGPDIFGKSTSTKKTLGLIKIVAEIFDKTGTVTKLGEKFDQDIVAGITYGAKNIKTLLSNKFVLYSAAEQVLYLSKLIFTYKVFNLMVNGKTASLFAKDSENPVKYLLLLAMKHAIKEVVDLIYNNLSAKFSNSLNKDLAQTISKIALKEDNAQTVVKLGDKAKSLYDQVSSITSLAKEGISSATQTIALPFINTSAISYGKSSVTLLMESYPGMVLSEMLINSIFSSKNIEKIKKWYGEEVMTQLEPDYDVVSQKMGLFSISTHVTPLGYAFNNIQEIIKLGGNKYMLDKVLKHLDKKCESGLILESSSKLNKSFDYAKARVEEFVYLMLFKYYNIDQQKLFSFEADLATLKTVIFGTNEIYRPDIDLADMSKTLLALQSKSEGGPTRLLNKDFSLMVEKYTLKSDKDLVAIPQIKFEPGVTAITGKIGTGKTTFLTDIAKCMLPAFTSSGAIYYPQYDGADVPLVFCGTTAFSPPATTLFEKLTYRLPNDYKETHKEELETSIISLFEEFGQSYNRDKLQVKGPLEASTGQSKLIMLITTILYKQYLNKPVLLVLDETLANLDWTTTAKVCAKIKEVFSDSIVIAVDHNASHNTDFYSNYVDLSHFTPSIETSQLEHKEHSSITLVDDETPVTLSSSDEFVLRDKETDPVSIVGTTEDSDFLSGISAF